MKLVSVEQMRHIEQASDAAGHSYAAMMERAGTAVAQAILVPRGKSQISNLNLKSAILIGPGNNGGDGLVAARALREAGAQVSCYLFRDRPDDPLLTAVRDLDCSIAIASDDDQFHELRRLTHDADVIVDALLGTGTARPIEGDLAKILEIVKERGQDQAGTRGTRKITRFLQFQQFLRVPLSRSSLPWMAPPA